MIDPCSCESQPATGSEGTGARHQSNSHIRRRYSSDDSAGSERRNLRLQ